jgi:hypothetical protein
LSQQSRLAAPWASQNKEWLIEIRRSGELIGIKFFLENLH